MAKHDGNVNSHNELSPGHGGEHPTVGHESSARLEDESEPPDPPISDDSTFRSSQVARSSRSSSHSGKDDDARDINAAHVIVTLADEHGDRSSPASSHQQHMQVGDAATKAHTLTTERCVSQLKTDAELGLSEADAKSRLEANGSNTIKEAKATSVWTILLHQVANALTVILLAAMALSFGVRDWVEGGVVCAVIAINVAIGFVQEYKAEHALASLRSLSSPLATVIRDGQVQEIDARNIVVGDIVNFRVGDLMPADLRIASSTNLEIEEASLTGESVPVIKTLDPIVEEDGIAAPPADCTNMAFAGTTVTKGRGRGLVIATGMNTQIGCIARQLDRRGGKKDNTSLPLWRQIYEPIARFLGLRSGTPLQRKLSAFALILLALALVCAIIVFAVAEFDLTNEVILYAIALGIGVLPESLIAVLTITFSVGAKRMAKSNVVVRKLDALEALGGISDIFSDKTGTLTHGKMVVNKAWLVNSEETWRIEQGGEEVLEPKGAIVREDKGGQEVGEEARTNNLHPLALAASLCNLAEVYRDYDTEKWQSRGDPTEVALQVFALKMGFDRAQLLEKQYSLEQEHPFDSMTKRMTMMYSIQTGDATGREKVLFMKGAPERVLDCCSTYQRNSEGPSPISLDEEARHRITAQMETLASHGLRVLAFARRRLTDVEYYKLGQEKLTRAVAEQDFEFIGLCGLHDPPRMETLEAVRTCQGGHIIVHMLTGDHISTARAIARQVGILDGTEPASAVMTASKFDAMSDEEVDKLPMLPLVIARCSPTTKVRMVAAGERRKTFLLMCGDGINDAPALLHAPIGIAMGSGTEVAKDSAQLILTDDKFDNIPKAVKEGRTVFKNIQRFMVALLVLNVAEVLLLLIGLAIRDDSHESVFPISPIGILILNLVAGLPAIGLGFEEAEEDVMTKPPHNVKAGVLSRQVIWDLFIYGFTMGWTSLVVFVGMIYGVHGAGSSLGSDCNGEGSEFSATACTAIFEARSATFCTLFLQGLIITWHLISIEETLFRIQTVQRLGRNKFLLWSVIFGFACIPICIYVPVWSTDIFRQSSLSGEGWGVALGANALFLLVVELWKFAARRGAWPWLTRFTGGSPSRKRSSHGMEEKHSA